MNGLSKASATKDWKFTPDFASFSNKALNAGNDAPDDALACVARMPG